MRDRHHDLTLDEFKAIVCARYVPFERLVESLSLEDRIRVEANLPDSVSIETLRVEIFEPIVTHISQRLKMDRRDIPLISANDFNELYPLFIGEAMKSLRDQLGPALGSGFELGFEHNELHKEIDEDEIEQGLMVLVKGLFEAFVKALVVSSRGGNLYEDAWSYINAVVDLAKDKGMSVEELASSDVYRNEIIRSNYASQEEYKTYRMKVFDSMISAENAREIFLAIFKVNPGVSEDDLREAEKAYDGRIGPQVQFFCEFLQFKYRLGVDKLIALIWSSESE